VSEVAIGVQEIGDGVADHLVHFYDLESDLPETVGPYLASGVQDGDVVFVIATEEHHRAFEDAIIRAGVDLAAAQRRATYVALDAASTLAAFVVGGRIDAGLFDAVVGRLVREAVESGRHVRAYGEMVALLWDAGDVMGAIELESLWNDLGRTLPFSLLCAYPTASVSGSELAGALGTVCHLHSATLEAATEAPSGSEAQPARVQVAQRFPAALDSPRAARWFLADTLRRWRQDAVIDDAAVVLTELVTNAVLHSASPPTVVIRSEEASIRLSVHDASPVLPAPRAHDPLAQSGRGLAVVMALAVRWGTHETVDGKVVWAEFHRSPTRRG
jgi:hypothetical protein